MAAPKTPKPETAPRVCGGAKRAPARAPATTTPEARALMDAAQADADASAARKARVRRAEDCDTVTAVFAVSARRARLPRGCDDEARALGGLFRAYDDGGGPRVRFVFPGVARAVALSLQAVMRRGSPLHYGARLTLLAPGVRASHYTLIRANNPFGAEWLAH